MDLMKKIFFVLLLVFSSSLFPQKSSKPIEVEEFVLDNGLNSKNCMLQLPFISCTLSQV